MIYLLTAIGLSPGGSIHLHTNNTQNNINNNRTTQIQTNVEECGPCPVFASFTLAFALQLRKKHGKTSGTSQFFYFQIPIKKEEIIDMIITNFAIKTLVSANTNTNRSRS